MEKCQCYIPVSSTHLDVYKRQGLYRLSRRLAVKSDEEKTAEVKTRIAQLSKEISRLRMELSLCDGIAVWSGVIKEKIQSVREDENKGKENRDRPNKQRSGR